MQNLKEALINVRRHLIGLLKAIDAVLKAL